MIAVSEITKNIDVVLNFEDDTRSKTSLIANKIKELLKSPADLEKGRVIATDSNSNDIVVELFNCPVFFERYDFDEMAKKANGLTNDNFTENEIISTLKNEIEEGRNKNEFD